MSYKTSSKMPSQRQLRVGEEIRHGLAQIFLNEPIYHPELRDISITVSEVRISPDLKNATVFASPLGHLADDKFINALNQIAPMLRKTLPRYVHLRFTPQIIFRRDDSFTEGNKIEEILKTIKDEEDSGG